MMSLLSPNVARGDKIQPIVWFVFALDFGQIAPNYGSALSTILEFSPVDAGEGRGPCATVVMGTP
jgi:hypothetical protein